MINTRVPLYFSMNRLLKGVNTTLSAMMYRARKRIQLAVHARYPRSCSSSIDACITPPFASSSDAYRATERRSRRCTARCRSCRSAQAVEVVRRTSAVGLTLVPQVGFVSLVDPPEQTLGYSLDEVHCAYSLGMRLQTITNFFSPCGWGKWTWTCFSASSILSRKV